MESLNLDTRLAVFPSSTLYQFLASSGTLAYTSVYSEGIQHYTEVYLDHMCKIFLLWICATLCDI